MLAPSEEVTQTWIKRKGLLIKSRPEPSRFSFVVCLSLVFSIALGFLAGFITAGFALSDNYSMVYENLLTELENTRRGIENEREMLVFMKKNMEAPVAKASLRPTPSGHQLQEQAIFDVFKDAVGLLQKGDLSGCVELNNIIKLNGYNGQWKDKAKYLSEKNCTLKAKSGG